MSVDKNDASIGWTVQHGTAIPEEYSAPGQVFHVSQLPDPERQAAELGPNYPEIYATVNGAPNPELVVEDRKEAELHPQGPEPHELDRADVRREIVEKATKDLEAREKEVAKAKEEAEKNRGGENPGQPEKTADKAPTSA